MKLIGSLTEDQAIAVVAAVVSLRAVRGARIIRTKHEDIYRSFAVEVDTYSAEEESPFTALRTL